MSARILAVDTATEACSVAVLDGARLWSRFEERGRDNAQRILLLVEAVLREAGLALREIDALAAGVGPGAFTGVRLSVAVAQGLARGAGLPVVPVTSLEALASAGFERWPDSTAVLACLDARMREVYWCRYRPDPEHGVCAVEPARVGAPETVPRAEPGARCVGMGRGIRVLEEHDSWHGEADRDALPTAAAMARLAARRLAAGAAIDVHDLAPVYLRDKVALTEAERAAARAGVT